MPIGRPDWYLTGLSENVATTNDTGELAVRLNSPVNYDRTGKILFLEDFSTLKRVSTALSFNLATQPNITSADFQTGCSSIHARLNNVVGSGYYIKYLNRTWLNSVMSLEVAIKTSVTPRIFAMYLLQHTQSGNRHYSFRLNYSPLTFAIRIQSGSYTNIPLAAGEGYRTDMFETFKLDVDTANDMYVRLRHNSLTYDLSSYQVYNDNINSSNYLEATLEFQGTNGSYNDIYVDRLILSEDE